MARWRVLKLYRYFKKDEGGYERVLVDVVPLPPDTNISTTVGKDEDFEVYSEWVE